MLKSLLQRAREARAAELGDGEGLEEGFTLIELMVVLLIIAILLAIAIPTFLGVTNSASDRAAQSNLTNALTEAKAIFQNSSSYTGRHPGRVHGLGAGVLVADRCHQRLCGSQTSTCVSMQVVDVAAANDGLGLVMASYSAKSSTCWYAAGPRGHPGVDQRRWRARTSGPPSSVPATGASTAGVFYAKKSGSANCLRGQLGRYPRRLRLGHQLRHAPVTERW